MILNHPHRNNKIPGIYSRQFRSHTDNRTRPPWNSTPIQNTKSPRQFLSRTDAAFDFQRMQLLSAIIGYNLIIADFQGESTRSSTTFFSDPARFHCRHVGIPGIPFSLRIDISGETGYNKSLHLSKISLVF